MSYVYKDERRKLFTERGQRVLLAVRDSIFSLIETAGACRAAEAMDAAVKRLGAADTWEMLACLDRLVELHELAELPTGGWEQHRIFVRTRSGVHLR